VIVIVVLVGTLVTINFLSAKSAALKLELVIAENVEASPNNIISPAEKLCVPEKVIVTVGSLLVVLKQFVIAVPDGLTSGCIS